MPNFKLINYQNFARFWPNFVRKSEKQKKMPEFFENFPRTFRSFHAAFRQHPGIGTSSGGRCMRPDATFLAHAAARHGPKPAAITAFSEEGVPLTGPEGDSASAGGASAALSARRARARPGPGCPPGAGGGGPRSISSKDTNA